MLREILVARNIHEHHLVVFLSLGQQHGQSFVQKAEVGIEQRDNDRDAHLLGLGRGLWIAIGRNTSVKGNMVDNLHEEQHHQHTEQNKAYHGPLPSHKVVNKCRKFHLHT